jgi:hypothetical protein
MNRNILLDKELIKSLFISVFYFLYTKVILTAIYILPDRYFSFVIEPTIYKKDDDDSDSDSDSDGINTIDLIEETKTHNTLDEYAKFLQLWEYDILLHLFNLDKYSFKQMLSCEKNKIEIVYNKFKYRDDNYFNMSSEDYKNINILDCFLFNIQVSKVIVNNNNKECSRSYIQNISQFKFKLIVFNYICNNYINSKLLSKLFPNHRYLYIKYKYKTFFKYIVIDLKKNYNLITHKNVLFNKISVN